MTTLKITQKGWVQQMRNDDSQIIMITRHNDKWYFLDHQNAYRISELRIMIDEGFGLRPEYDYSENTDDINPLDSTIVVHLSESKTVVSDSSGYYGFGFSDIESPAKELYISFKSPELSGSISACRDSSTVFVVRDVEQTD